MVSSWGRGVLELLGLHGWVQDAAGESCSPPCWSQPPLGSCSLALSPSELISITRANGEHKNLFKSYIYHLADSIRSCNNQVSHFLSKCRFQCFPGPLG